MTKVLNWIEVLNEQTTWINPADLPRWYCGLTGRQTTPSEAEIADFLETLTFIRKQATALHFREPLDFDGIDQRLADVSLAFCPAAGHARLPAAVDAPACCSQSGSFQGSEPLPTLHARPRGESDGALIRAIGDTVLMRFAEFAGECIDSNFDVDIARCEGIYREAAPQPEYVNPFEPRVESRWRKEIPILVQAGLEESEDIQRCCDFFVLRPKARFCSEECRFRTFQLTKQLSDPGYLAAKQKRYRDRHK